MKRYPWQHPWLLTSAALALLLVGQLFAQRLAHAADTLEGPDFHMAWRFRPATFQQGLDRAQLIVLADVTAVNRGPDLVGYHPEEPGGETHYPTQRITLKVLKAYRGQLAPGQTLTLFQDGGSVDGSTVASFAEDNPRYRQGERYVLLLEWAEAPDLWRITAPEGRYRIERGDIVMPIIPDNPVVRDLRGKPLKYLEQLLATP